MTVRNAEDRSTLRGLGWVALVVGVSAGLGLLWASTHIDGCTEASILAPFIFIAFFAGLCVVTLVVATRLYADEDRLGRLFLAAACVMLIDGILAGYYLSRLINAIGYCD